MGSGALDNNCGVFLPYLITSPTPASVPLPSPALVEWPLEGALRPNSTGLSSSITSAPAAATLPTATYIYRF